MADELDLPARRLRGSVRRRRGRLRDLNLTFEAAEKRLDDWIAAAQ